MKTVSLKFKSSLAECTAQATSSFTKSMLSFQIDWYNNLHFNIQTSELNCVNLQAYLVDFYARSSTSNDDDVPTHIGFSYILPSVMKTSEGQAIVPITGLRHQPIGQLTG
jgi:hypothetical protein